MFLVIFILANLLSLKLNFVVYSDQAEGAVSMTHNFLNVSSNHGLCIAEVHGMQEYY